MKKVEHEFDVQSLREKARRTYEKKAHINQEIERKKYFETLYVIKNIETLISWAKSKNNRVVLSSKNVSAFFASDKLIRIKRQNSLKNMMYDLLHECSHLSMTFTKSYDSKYDFKSRPDERKTSVKLDILSEELEAWYVGIKLAQCLLLSIDKKEYEKKRSECVMTYVRWVARKK